MPIQLKQPLTITGGTGVTASNSGVAFDGTQQIIQQISVGQDIDVTDNVQFNSITASSWKLGDDISIYDNGQVLGSVTHTGTTSISSTLSIFKYLNLDAYFFRYLELIISGLIIKTSDLTLFLLR